MTVRRSAVPERCHAADRRTNASPGSLYAASFSIPAMWNELFTEERLTMSVTVDFWSVWYVNRECGFQLNRVDDVHSLGLRNKVWKELGHEWWEGSNSPQYAQYALRVRPSEQTPGSSQDCNHFKAHVGGLSAPSSAL